MFEVINSDQVKSMNAAFCWQRHKHVKDTLSRCESNTEHLELRKPEYNTTCKKIEMHKLTDLWNTCFKDHPSVIFSVKKVLKQYLRIKANIFALMQRNIVDDCYAHNERHIRNCSVLNQDYMMKIGRLSS